MIQRQRLDAPARLEPAVKDLFDSLQVALALLRRDGDVVDALSVQVFDARHTGQLLQLLNGSDAHDLESGLRTNRSEHLTSFMSSLAQSGIGVPQYRFLEMFQSRAFFNQPPNRPSPTFCGTHRVFSLFATRRSETCATRTNHAGMAR